jgi:hypothetical protein
VQWGMKYGKIEKDSERKKERRKKESLKDDKK